MDMGGQFHDLAVFILVETFSGICWIGAWNIFLDIRIFGTRSLTFRP